MSAQRAELIYQLVGVVLLIVGIIAHNTRRRSYLDEPRPWHRDPAWWAAICGGVLIVVLILIGKYW